MLTTDTAQLVTEREVATILKMSLSFLQKDRHRNPPALARVPYVKLGRSVRYRLSDITALVGASA